jgi:selenocysteine lyase/cysteine desulfurase
LVGNNINVPVYGGEELPYINLDNSATTSPFEIVLEKINELLPFYGSVHRGCGYKSLLSTELYGQARQTIFSFADGTKDEDVLFFGINATSCVNHLARRLNLKTKEVVIISENEHTSNVLPWRKTSTVLECRSDLNDILDLDHLETLLKANNVKIVAVTGASNVTGKITDTDSIACLAHKYGAEIFVDGSQLAGHRKIKRGTPGSANYIDYLVFSAHKMYAPFGVVVLIGNKKIFSDGWPEMVGGGSVKWIDGMDISWSDLPDREMGGSPNYIGVIALAESCKIIDSIGFENIIEHEKALIKYALEVFKEIPIIRFVNKFNIGTTDEIPLFSFHIKGLSPALVGAFLGYEKAIGVRTGTLCQFNLVRKFLNLLDEDIAEIKSNLTGNKNHIQNIGIIRASCGLGNTVSDIEKLAKGLKELIEGGPGTNYVIAGDGSYRPDNYFIPYQ